MRSSGECTPRSVGPKETISNDGCLPQASLLGVGVFGYGCGLFGGSVGVLREQGKDSSLVKIVPQLPGCDRLCPVWREVGKTPPALLAGHALPQQEERKLVKAGSLGKCLPYRPVSAT